MFCGNCGAQVPDGSAVCPKCGKQLAAKSKAPQMNQASQNAGARANGAAGGSGKKFDVKKVGIIAGAVVAVIALVLVLKGIFGGVGIEDGTYVNMGFLITVDGNKMTVSSFNDDIDYVVEYDIKDDTIVFDLESVELTEETLEYLEDELDYDEDEIEEELEKCKDRVEVMIEAECEYKEKKKIIVLGNAEYRYAEDYEIGPSGKFTCEDDEDITITFEDGKATYDNNGEKETVPYYCYKISDHVAIIFYGEDLLDSNFNNEYYEGNKSYSLCATFDDDEVVITRTTFKQ